MRDAFDLIRKQSKEHARAGDHYGKGVNLVMKLPDDEDKALVTLDLDNVPLIDALR